jgi:protein transport protein SEC24
MSSVFTSLGIVPSITGGELLFHARYHSLRDQLLLASQIRRIFERETGYQVATKLRCTTGKPLTSICQITFES